MEKSVAEKTSKPTVRLIGTDGNVFALIGKVDGVLRKHDKDKAKEFRDRAFAAGSYDEVLRIIMEYVEVE